MEVLIAFVFIVIAAAIINNNISKKYEKMLDNTPEKEEHYPVYYESYKIANEILTKIKQVKGISL